MDDMSLKINIPVVSGCPRPKQAQKAGTDAGASADRESFQSMLMEKLLSSSEVTFSKHAVKRALDHNIELSDESLSRLNEGVKLASEKKLEDPLILVGGTAFLVNIPNNTVITAIDSDDMKGNVFTHIDGTVII